MINWTVRFRNKNFWMAFVPALLLLVQGIADLFGVRLDLGAAGDKVLAVINAAFVVLSILGVVNDPTTAGLEDSTRALGYEWPKRRGE